MNVCTSEIAIDAPPATVYGLAAATARWPLILPHYRYVRVRDGDERRSTVEMSCWRHLFPLRWIAEQVNDPVRPHIAFRHLAGPARGMEVEWIFTPAGTGTQVTIVHRLGRRLPALGAWLERRVVGDYFITGVARRTLRAMKRAAERRAVG